MESTEKKNNFSRFFRILGIVCACLIFVIIIGLTVFWKYLDCYEKSVPTFPLSEFIENIREEDYDSALKLCDPDNDTFENAEQLKTYLSVNLQGNLDNVRFLKASSDSKTGEVKYSIYVDGNKKMAATVEKSDKSVGFGCFAYRLKGLELIYLDDIKVTVPSGAKVYADGKELDSAEAEENRLSELFAGVPEEFCPSTVTYTVKNSIVYPEIAVILSDGTVVEKNESGSDYNLMYNIPVSEEEKNEYCELALKLSKSYAGFIIGDYSYDKLLSDVYKNCDFYKNMREYDNSWYGSHSNVKYENVTYSDINKYDENHISVNVKILQKMTRAGKQRTFDLDYTVSFIFIDGEWKACNLISN